MSMPTNQETAVYDALNAGDRDAIDELHDAAYGAEQTPDETTSLTPAEQYEQDYANAWNHYQADHEAPERARELATRASVDEQNAEADTP